MFKEAQEVQISLGKKSLTSIILNHKCDVREWSFTGAGFAARLMGILHLLQAICASSSQTPLF